MSSEDTRWVQRLQNFEKAFALLDDAVLLRQQRPLSQLEEQGLIQRFEFTHELAWNVLKDYLEYQGNFSITGSRDATREAFNKGLIEDGEGWMNMIKSRNQSSHTYNESVAAEVIENICLHYWGLFAAFQSKMKSFID